MTAAPVVDPENPWTLDEFVERLNMDVPLTQGHDARRAPSWNARLVRHYTTNKTLSSPEKRGRQAFYGPQHLLEAGRLTSLQEVGLTSKSVAMLAQGHVAYESSCSMPTVSPFETTTFTSSNVIAPSVDERRAQALAMLSQWDYGAKFLPSPSRPLKPSPGILNAVSASIASFEAARTNDLMSWSPSVKAPTSTPASAEQWHRWSPVLGLEISVREDLWEREADLRERLNQWLNPQEPSS